MSTGADRGQLRKLIASDRLEQVIEVLAGEPEGETGAGSHELIQHQATLKRAKVDRRMGVISYEDEDRKRTRVRLALLELIDALGSISARPDDSDRSQPAAAKRQAASGAGGDPARAKRAFISYNHRDAEVADKLDRALAAAGLEVCIDRRDMNAGERIADFIKRAVAESDVTILVVSEHSLLSPWVGIETVRSLTQEELEGGSRLIGCYVDQSFLESGFRLAATDKIDARLEEIERQIPSYQKKKIDTVDLDTEKSRLFKLRNELGEILLRLKESLVLDVREETFPASVDRLIRVVGGEDGPRAGSGGSK